MQILRDKDLRPYNSLALQVTANALVTVGSERELLAAISWADEHGLSVLPLGAGSNVVFAGNQETLVVRQNTRGIDILQDSKNTVCLRIAAGESWHGLVRWTLQQGIYGLENLALIPGTVGAAPIQNIGAYGVELGSCLLYTSDAADDSIRV